MLNIFLSVFLSLNTYKREKSEVKCVMPYLLQVKSTNIRANIIYILIFNEVKKSKELMRNDEIL